MNCETIFTVGYEGRTAAEIVKLLRSAGVSRLVDVRAVPLSRKPEFRKNALAAILAEANIAYTGVPQLGTPRWLRDRLVDDRDYRSFFRDYKRFMRRQREPLFDLAGLATAGRIALMCFEADATTCHRSAVAAQLSLTTQLAVVHLGSATRAASAR